MQELCLETKTEILKNWILRTRDLNSNRKKKKKKKKNSFHLLVRNHNSLRCILQHCNVYIYYRGHTLICTSHKLTEKRFKVSIIHNK